MLPTSNFAFLSMHDPQLAQLGALAERYFRDDPGTAVIKLRQFAELLSKTIAARHALYLGERESFEETLRRLSYERIIPKETADVFHALRKAATVPLTRPEAHLSLVFRSATTNARLLRRSKERWIMCGHPQGCIPPGRVVVDAAIADVQPIDYGVPQWSAALDYSPAHASTPVGQKRLE
jgi:hypothetical protein